ncbi:MAG: LamG-like jellyroll fold domain-containing protein [Planctomycetota bacterium]
MFEKKFLMSLLCLVVVLSFSATATRGANILFVSSMTVVEEDALKAFMEGLGHTVTYIDDDEDEATTEAAVIAADLVFISESVSSGKIKNEITELEVPMIVGEPYAWDEMGLTEGGGGDDPAITTDVEIVDPGHYLAAGLSGTVAVLTDITSALGASSLGKGITGPEATVIATATLSDGVTYDVIFIYEKGAALPVAPADGSAQVAADIRIGFGFHANSFPVLSDNAYALLGAAVEYALLTAIPEPEPVVPNLIGWWPLNEGSGDTAIDLSGSGNDGTISNLNGGLGPDGSVWVDDPVRGTVISFNGTADGAFVRAGDIPQMTLTNDFTWAFWAKQNAENTANNDIILGNRMDENGVDFVPRQFIKFTPTKFEWHMNGNGDDNLDYDDIPADVWLHHTVVKTADQLTYYRNGVEASSGTFTQALDFPQPLFFGGDNEASAGENWGGLMSEVRIYDGALTGLEILAIVKGVEKIDMEIGFAAQPPVLDGEVDGIWADASTQYIVPLDDPANASGSWKVLYDSVNLYVIMDISDDSLVNDSSSSWQDDSVEFYFDGGNSKENTPLAGDNRQYTFGWTTDDIQGVNTQIEGIEHAQVDTDTGWRIEIKFPWLSLQDTEPQAGDLIGIDVYYNDDDDGGDSRENKLLTFSTEEFWNDASQWGTAVLAIIPEPVDPGTDGLVAFYALENDVLDGSGNELHGTIVGNPTFVEGPAGYGMAMEFDGETYVDCSNDPRLDITGPFSGGIWIRPDTLGGPDSVAPLCKAGVGWSWQLRFAWGSGGQDDIIGWQFNTPAGSTWIYVGQPLPVGEWYHIAASHDGETVRCYLDGVETDSAPMTAINSSPSSLLIGSEGWGFHWIGAIDEVAIYDRGLSDEEVLYLAGFRSDTNILANGSFESGVDAWEIMDPAETLTQSTEGVTDGTYSMQRNFVSGWHEIDLDVSGFVDVLNANDTLEVDVTCSITAEEMGWWLEQVIVLQGGYGDGAGDYYIQSPVVNVASPDGTPTTTTVSFNYGPELTNGPLTGWAKIRLIGNTGPGPAGVLYYDNLRAVTPAP